MKRRFLALLCLVLALLLSSAALAEALPPEDDGILSREQVEAVVTEITTDLSEAAGEESGADAEEPPEDAQPQFLADVNSSEDTDAPTQEEPPAQEESPSLGEPIAAKTIAVKKSLSKTVYLGIPYVLNVKGGIKSVSSNAKKVATADKSGVLTLKKKGKAKLTIKTKKGKKWTVTLTVKGIPTPENLKAESDESAITLSWSAAKHATGYMVQQSEDGEAWVDYKRLSSGDTSLALDEVPAGSCWFRVAAILGDVLGGVSEPLSILGPLTEVKVICQESYSEGPTDRMNVVWKGCNGANRYEVYHASLPSEEYSLLGTTKENWYPVTRSVNTLDAYRVKPVFGDYDLPMSDPVTLWSGMQENVLPTPTLTSDSGIILVVNKRAQVVTAYVRDGEGKYTIPLRHMICSTGKIYNRTKNGTYKLKSRGGEWHQYSTGYYIRWPSTYRDGYYFHSPLYRPNKTISSGTVRQLGTRQSLGCIRLKVRDAEWVYKHCAKGTTVLICDGEKKDALKKAIVPQTVKVKGF